MKKVTLKIPIEISLKNVTFMLLTNDSIRVKTCVQASMFAIFYAVWHQLIRHSGQRF